MIARIPNPARITRRWWHARVLLVGLTATLLAPAAAPAGGGPEGVFLVVNSQSASSLTIANHFVHLRKIPSINVFQLPWSGSVTAVNVERFRREILGPVLAEIARRKLTEQIDYIVYSSDFPYAINFAEDLPGEPERYGGSLASITGLTYLNSLVMNRDQEYAQWSRPTNRYVNYLPSSMPTRGFRHRYAWGQHGERVSAGGQQYHLSMMLGYTSGRGNTVDEVVQYLRRSSLADGTHPPGTVYFMQNGDVRSRVRDSSFSPVVAGLEKMGIQAEIMQGIVPLNRRDVMGAVIGKATFDWSRYRSRILPGAICEHFTSYGGILRSDATQTPLTELLRHGAAGASGTVVEPYAMQQKFPHPSIHLHYAKGSSLAEAFYQSVATPYQLLIVGDPLCRPWATIPTVTVETLEPGQTVSETISLQPQLAQAVPVNQFELYVDGRFIQSCRPGEGFELDTHKLSDGYHELRIVAVEESLIESQGRLILPIQVDNTKRSIRCQARPAGVAGQPRYVLQVASPGSRAILVFYHRQLLGRVNGAQGQVMIDARQVGHGPVPLTVVGVGNGESGNVFAAPVMLQIPGVPESAGPDPT